MGKQVEFIESRTFVVALICLCLTLLWLFGSIKQDAIDICSQHSPRAYCEVILK